MNRHQLADAMIKGLHTPNVVESQMRYIAILFFDSSDQKELCQVCALGSAVVGYFDGDYKRAQLAFRSIRKGEYDAFAELLDVSSGLVIEVEHRHLNGQSIEQIAAWLRSSEQEMNA